jgi:hypothetical protein
MRWTYCSQRSADCFRRCFVLSGVRTRTASNTSMVNSAGSERRSSRRERSAFTGTTRRGVCCRFQRVGVGDCDPVLDAGSRRRWKQRDDPRATPMMHTPSLPPGRARLAVEPCARGAGGVRRQSAPFTVLMLRAHCFLTTRKALLHARGPTHRATKTTASIVGFLVCFLG